MDSKLLEYYNRELAYLREMGAEFAERYPKVAGRLGMRGIDVADPYIERLMEGFAFLTSRVQLKMDAEFPRFSQRLLEMIAPTISRADAVDGDCGADAGQPQGRPEQGLHRAARHHDGQPGAEENRRDLQLYHGARGHPAAAENRQGRAGRRPRRSAAGAAGAEPAGAAAPCGSASPAMARKTSGTWISTDLEFFLGGPDIEALKLLELVMEHHAGIVCQTVSPQPQRQVLADDALRQEGFAPDQALLPDDLRNFDGYRLLQEYFAFPARFRFISLSRLSTVSAPLR